MKLGILLAFIFYSGSVNATETVEESSCGTEGDVVFLLDNSGSVSKSDFKLMLGFVKDVVKKIYCEQDQSTGGPRDVRDGGTDGV